MSNWNNVRLLTAEPRSFWGANAISVTVHVKNLSTEHSRIVKAHYYNGVNWVDSVDFTLIGNYGDYSLYRGQIPQTTARFVIKYQAGGITYWDNNNGVDYYVAAWTSPHAGIVGGNVGLSSAKVKIDILMTKYGATYIVRYNITGQIYVKNRSYEKQVGVVLHDGYYGWMTTYGTYECSMDYGSQDIEIWNFKYISKEQHPHAYEPFKIAVFYKEINGGSITAEHWDNNFFMDYTLNSTDGTEIQ